MKARRWGATHMSSSEVWSGALHGAAHDLSVAGLVVRASVLRLAPRGPR